MKIIQISSIFLFLLFSFSSVAQKDFRKNPPKAGPAPQIEMGSFEEFKLDNGLKVIVVENHKLPQVSFQVFIDLPPIKEGQHAGLADIAGQLLNKGTSKRTKAQIDEEIDFIGASLSTSANGLYGSALTKHKAALLEVMADVLFNPTFPQGEFEKVKKQTLSTLAQNQEDPNAIASNVAKVLRYGKEHPYGEVMTEKTVETLNVDMIKAYYEKYFRPNLAYLIVVGDINKTEVEKIAHQYFGEWERGIVMQDYFEKPEKPAKTEVDFVDKTGAVQSVIAITYPVALKPTSEDVIKASVMNTMLGGYFRSRLNNNIREDKAYSYGVRSSLSRDKNIGYFTAGGSVRNEVTDSALVEFMHEINRMRDEKAGQEELDLVKNVMAGRFARSLENPETVARFALNTTRYKLPKDYYATYLEKLSQVTADDVQAMAKKYLSPDQAHIMVVGNKDEVADKLTHFSADNKVKFFDAYGTELKEKTKMVPEGITAENIITNYINAIGGKEKLMRVKDVSTVAEAKTPMGNLSMSLYQKAPNKLALTLSAGGMVVQEQKFDGTNGSSTTMGQTQKVEGQDLEALKAEANLFPELRYAQLGYQLQMKGVDNIDGKQVYKVAVTGPDGKKRTDFYDVATGLKIRSVQVRETEGKTITITNNYDDYKEVDGVKFPHLNTLLGAMPMALKMEVSELKVNAGIEDAVFEVK